MIKPLQGIRVLDLTTNISGPFATMILSDLGAEVIKIERVEGGDDARQMTPFFGEWGTYFLGINRNKQSVAVNFKSPEGLKVIYRLARTCDVVVQNFRGGKADKLGLGYGHFKAEREDIVYCTISAYGSKGPLHEFPGYDALVQAQTGVMSVNGTNEGDLSRVGVSLLDMGSGMWAALAVVSALLTRKDNGQGQQVATSLYETGIMWGLYHLTYVQATGSNPEPQGTKHTAFAPYGAYDTADGKLFIGISNDRLFAKLCEAVNRPEWVDDSRFRNNAQRLKYRSELEDLLNRELQRKPLAEWLAELTAKGVPSGQVKLFSEVLEDPQLAALGQLEEVMVEGVGSLKLPKLPIQMDSADMGNLTRAPLLGEHTRHILSQLGYSQAEIDRLVRERVLSDGPSAHHPAEGE